jgi:hypothetical protein
MSYKKDELIKMCKKHNLKTDGTKDDLCKRLLSKEEKSPPKNGKRLHVRHLKDDEDIDTVLEEERKRLEEAEEERKKKLEEEADERKRLEAKEERKKKEEERKRLEEAEEEEDDSDESDNGSGSDSEDGGYGTGDESDMDEYEQRKEREREERKKEKKLEREKFKAEISQKISEMKEANSHIMAPSNSDERGYTIGSGQSLVFNNKEYKERDKKEPPLCATEKECIKQLGKTRHEYSDETFTIVAKSLPQNHPYYFWALFVIRGFALNNQYNNTLQTLKPLFYSVLKDENLESKRFDYIRETLMGLLEASSPQAEEENDEKMNEKKELEKVRTELGQYLIPDLSNIVYSMTEQKVEWDVDNIVETKIADTIDMKFYCSHLSRHGKILGCASVSSDTSIVVIDTETFQHTIFKNVEEFANVASIFVFPDSTIDKGRILYSIYHVPNYNGTKILEYTGNNYTIKSISDEGTWRATFSPDNKLFATAEYHDHDGRVRYIRVYSSKTLKRIATPQNHTIHCMDIAFSPDGKHLAWSEQFDIYYVNTHEWEPIRNGWADRSSHDINRIESFSFSSDGLVASINKNGLAHVVSNLIGYPTKVEKKINVSPTRDMYICFSPDNKYILIGASNISIYRWKKWKEESGDKRDYASKQADIQRQKEYERYLYENGVKVEREGQTGDKREIYISGGLSNMHVSQNIIAGVSLTGSLFLYRLKTVFL